MLATRTLPPTGLLDARAFNVGTGIATDVMRLATVLMKVSKSTIPIAHAPERPGEQRTSYLEIKKAMSSLDWQPVVSLEEGLTRSFEWFAARHGAFLRDVSAWLREGRIKYREDVVDGIEKAPRALIGLLRGENFGKLLVRVAAGAG